MPDHLAQGIGIVGIVAHHVAVGVGVKVADRQRLHVGEHIVPDCFQRSLSDRYNQARLQEGGQNTGQIDAGHHGQDAQQRGKVRLRLPNQGRDIIVDQRFQEQGSGNAGCRADQQQQKNNSKPQLIGSYNIAHQPFHSAFGVLGLLAAAETLGSRSHPSSPPFC